MRIIPQHGPVAGLDKLLRALRLYANSQQLQAQRIIEKWTARAAILSFRLRPWLPSSRIESAVEERKSDMALALAEWRAVRV